VKGGIEGLLFRDANCWRMVKDGNPFIVAGWRKCGLTKGNLLILEKTMEDTIKKGRKYHEKQTIGS
jgi:hypothetical protein